MKRLRNKRGDTLVEVVLAIAIMSVTFVTAYNVVNNSYRVSVQSREQTQAAHIIQDQAEKLRAFRDAKVAASPTDTTTSLFTQLGTTNTFHMKTTSTGVEPEGGATTTCFGMPTCTTQITYNTSSSQCQDSAVAGVMPCFFNLTANGSDHRLDKVTVAISVEWDSVIGGNRNKSIIPFTLSDPRGSALCDNSLAGAC